MYIYILYTSIIYACNVKDVNEPEAVYPCRRRMLIIIMIVVVVVAAVQYREPEGLSDRASSPPRRPGTLT